MSGKKRISFLMPTFNRADYIAEAIASITSQMDANDEIIVIDDGSTDGTRTLLESIGDTIALVRQENSGKSVALNLGMERAKGDYIWICDDDDVMCEGAVATLVDLITTTGVDFVFGRYSKFTHRGNVRIDLGMAHWPVLERGSPARHILEDAFVMHNAALVRRSLYDQVGPFDPSMLRAQDYDMFVRCAIRGKAAFTSQTLFMQRKHAGARGPSEMLHSAGQSNTVWQQYDARIFNRLYAEVPIAFFERMFAGDDPALVKRAALLQRATIMARHGLWMNALTDWQTASAKNSEPLTMLEKDICRRAMAGKHGFAGALDKAALDGLLDLSRSRGLGAYIVQELVEGLVWRLRDHDEGNRALAWSLASRLGQRGKLLHGVINRLWPRSRSREHDQTLREVSDLALLD
ncbi:MAG: glycosyltransferase [Pseudomonadota bacterium]